MDKTKKYSAHITNNHYDEINDANNEVRNIKYSSFEELSQYPDNENLLDLLRRISNQFLEPSSCWTDTFYAITEIRRIRKFYPELFEHFYSILINSISDLLIQANTPISRNILKLTSEIFTQDYSQNVSDWIDKLLPTVFIKSISEIKVVAEEANQVLECFTQNIFYPNSFEILLENVNNKNIHISNKAFDYLMKFLNYFNACSFANISECLDWELIFHNLHLLCENKKETYITKAFKILDYFDYIFEIIQKEQNVNYNNLILSQIDSLDFHSRIEELYAARKCFYDIKSKKIEHSGNLNSTRHSIKSDKRKSLTGVNNFWRNELDENKENQHFQFEQKFENYNYQINRKGGFS